jgi:hypothetical protein
VAINEKHIMTDKNMTLEERVRAFQMMKLPGQPFGMHMGTAYLVADLEREIARLRDLCETSFFEGHSAGFSAACAGLATPNKDKDYAVSRSKKLLQPNAEAQLPPEWPQATEGAQSAPALWAVNCSASLGWAPILASRSPQGCRDHASTNQGGTRSAI